MSETIEMGTISSRGQICIPSSIREEMDLSDGSKVIFMLSGGTLHMRKAIPKTFAELTEPLRKAKKKIKEEEVVELIHRIRNDKSNS